MVNGIKLVFDKIEKKNFEKLSHVIKYNPWFQDPKKKNDFLGMMMWHVIPRHISLGPHISMS
jgi:hypothetical protein